MSSEYAEELKKRMARAFAANGVKLVEFESFEDACDFKNGKPMVVKDNPHPFGTEEWLSHEMVKEPLDRHPQSGDVMLHLAMPEEFEVVEEETT